MRLTFSLSQAQKNTAAIPRAPARTGQLRGLLLGAALGALIVGCAPPPLTPSTQHVARENAPAKTPGDIPPPVVTLPLPPKPQAAPREETYSVVVNEVPVRDLLFALARDAKINVDVHPSISGNVTMNALNQTLPQLLTRMSKQVDLRWEMSGANLSILPDAPFMTSYTVDYVNMTRSAATTVNVATQISTTGAGGAAGGGSGNNNSSTALTSNTANFFWESLAQNICNIVVTTRAISRQERSEQQQARDRDFDNRLNVARQLASAGSGAPQLMQQVTGGAGAAGASAPAVNCAQTGYNLSQSATGAQGAAATGAANPVISNREAGIIMVFATQRQHERVREFIDRVVSSARRQVLIEVTVVEVQLNSLYRQGINWQRLRNPSADAEGFSLIQQGAGVGGAVPGSAAATGAANAFTPVFGDVVGSGTGNFQLSFLNRASPIGNIGAALSLLGSFGNVRVLSSPKLSVLNNQTAMLKVVDNLVYFSVSGSSTPATATSPAINSFTTTAQSVAVGFVMSVTPQIDDTDQVTINVRPSLSRKIGDVRDPNPSLVVYPPGAVATTVPNPIANLVPVIQTREMESILKIPNRQIAVMGGLMQDNANDGEDSVPGLSRVPGVGELFRNRNETASKSELVIFLRPVVIKDPSLEGDFQKFRDSLPGQDFFRQPNPLQPAPFTLGRNAANAEPERGTANKQ